MSLKLFKKFRITHLLLILGFLVYGPFAISSYAADHPGREDLAEIMPLYLTLRFRPDRMSDELKEELETITFNRIRYLDCQSLSIDILD